MAKSKNATAQKKAPGPLTSLLVFLLLSNPASKQEGLIETLILVAVISLLTISAANLFNGQLSPEVAARINADMRVFCTARGL